MASGKVVDTHGAALDGVAITIPNATILSRTDANGLFRIGAPTSARALRGRDVTPVLSGGELLVRGLDDGMVTAAILDGLGRMTWTSRGMVADGVVRFRVPGMRGVHHGVLRLSTLTATHVFRVMELSDRTRGSRLGDVAGRDAAEEIVLRFHKEGFRDTSIALAKDTTTGITLAMSAGSSSVAPGAWMGDTIYSNHDGRVLMQSLVKLEFLADHQYVFSVTGQANWQPIIGDVFRGTGMWKELGPDSIEVALTACTQPDTSTLEVATFPAIVPFHEEGTGSDTYFVTNAQKSTPCPAPGRIWKPWLDTLSALLPVKMVLQDTVWNLSLIKR